MKFIREDYVKKKQRRNRSMLYLLLLTLGLMLISYVLFKKSPDDSIISQSDQAKVAETETGKSNKMLVPRESEARVPKNVNLPDLIATARKSVALIKIFDARDQLLARGSGFFIDRNLMVSNRHVFYNVAKAEAQVHNGKLSVKKVLAEHSDYDMVKLEVDTKKLKIKPLPINKKLPKVGESVVVIGNPLGLEATASNGIVSAVREIEPHGKVIQITCPISPGSSGSPVLNMRGEVIGVATFNIGSQEGGQNLNFAIPIARLTDLNTVENGDLASVSFTDPDLINATEDPFDQGMLLYTKKEYTGAIPYFKKATEDDPANAEAFYYLGICYREAGLTNAVDAFKSAIKIDPDYGKAYCQLGITYLKLNIKMEAIEAFREALRVNPDSEEALLHLGIAYYTKKDYRMGIKLLSRAIDIFPSVNGYYYKGACHYSIEQFGRAIQAFKNAIQMDPKNIEPYILLAASYAHEEDWKRGIEIMNQAYILDPRRPEVHYYLGVLHLGNDDIDSAQFEYETLRKLKGASKLASELSRFISRYKYSRRRRYR
jgi:tetratricopeptide (TPR) repeat protein